MNVYLSCKLNSAKDKLKQVAKRIIRGEKMPANKLFVDFTDDDFDSANHLKTIAGTAGAYINELNARGEISKDMVFPIENLITDMTLKKEFRESYRKKSKAINTYCSRIEEALPLWELFIANSRIPTGYRHAGLSYAGFINEYQDWCLPSWIWINGALARCFCTIDQTEKALDIGEQLLKYQTEAGGWVVRNDYGPQNVKPLMAPNDSAYIANNGCLTIYKTTRERKYLEAAIRCADWIIDTARPDGMVYFGFDTFKGEWDSNHNIVDVGFTAALFAELYRLTKEEKYQDFAQKFSNTYIKLFYDASRKRFWSSIGEGDVPRGTGFARGQAWALEGLIPVYELSRDKRVREIIENTIETMLDTQNADGSWPRDLDKPELGSDCKGTPVIAYSLLKWTMVGDGAEEINSRIKKAVQNTLDWCFSHTVKEGPGAGGIYSLCYEGAIVHHPYTSTAFVYGSSYALEIAKIMEQKW